jgi:hypothetical protein
VFHSGASARVARCLPCCHRGELIACPEVVWLAVRYRIHRRWPDRSAGNCRKADRRIIAQGRDGFQRHVAGARDGPFIILFSKITPTSRTIASSFGKMPTISVRRDLAVESSSGWSNVAWRDGWSRRSCGRVRRVSASSRKLESCGNWAAVDRRQCATGLAVSASSCANEVAIKGRDGTLAVAAKMRQGVAHEVDTAALPRGQCAHKFLAELLNHNEVRGLSDEHFSVDVTQVAAWAAMKSFGAKDGSDEPPPGGRNSERHFRGETRSNATRVSTTDLIMRRSFKRRGRARKPGSPSSATR